MKLGAWAFTVLAAALHAGELEFASLLAEVGGQTLEAGEALKERPRDVVHKAAERLARRIEREHRGWLIAEFGSDPTGRAEMAGMVAAIPDVLAEALSDLPAMVRADLKPQAIADLAVARIGRTDERFRPDTAGARMLRCLIIGTYAAARQDSEFDKAMARAVQEVLLERTSRLEAGQQRIEALLKAGGTPLHLLARHRLKAPPSDLRELLMTELRATDLVGREEELQSLKLWLAMARERRDISLHCLTGRAGAGKTRLAIELCEWAEYAGWSTGFVRQEELARFHEHHHPSEWRWPRPTLIVVDYAAASARVLRSWLDELARGEAGRQEAPLRILLLERHADREAGWWADLVRPGGLSGRGPDVLIDDGAPLALGPLRSDAHRRALLTQAMQLAAPVIGKSAVPLPPAGTDALFDQRLSSNAIETEPLFLIMAGVVAVESDAPAALALGRLDLGELVADAERSRLQRLARAAGADDSLTLHLAACVTLQGGCGAVAATELVEQERAALGDRSITRTDQLVGLLRELLPGQAGEAIDAVRPDLIGEAFLLKEIRPAPRQVDAVERAFRRAGRSVIGVVIRTAQDHAQGMAAHASVTWLDHLARLTDDPFALMAIAAELPEQTLALRERAAEITARIVTGLAARGATEPHLRPVHAGWTNNLANRLRELGNREAALSAAREAADLYRALATQRPDAFGPHLAGSLNTLAFMLTEQGDREAALSAAREAADLHRALAAQRPDAFRPVLAMSLNNMAIALSEMGDREGRCRRRAKRSISVEGWRRSARTSSGQTWQRR